AEQGLVDETAVVSSHEIVAIAPGGAGRREMLRRRLLPRNMGRAVRAGALRNVDSGQVEPVCPHPSPLPRSGRGGSAQSGRGRGSAPAAVNSESPLTAAIDPPAGAIPAPGAALDARGLGDLARDIHAAAAAGVDLAHVVVEAAARAADVNARIPARARTPRITRPRP